MNVPCVTLVFHTGTPVAIGHVYCECIFTVLVRFYSRTGIFVSCCHCSLSREMQNGEF